MARCLDQSWIINYALSIKRKAIVEDNIQDDKNTTTNKESAGDAGDNSVNNNNPANTNINNTTVDKPKASGFSVTVLVISIINILLCFSLFSLPILIASIFALKSVKKNNQSGKGFAVTAIILSCIGMAILVIMSIVSVMIFKSIDAENKVNKDNSTQQNDTFKKEEDTAMEGSVSSSGVLEIPEIGVSFDTSDATKDIIYKYENDFSEEISFTTQSLIDAEEADRGYVYECSSVSAPLGSIRVLRPDDTSYDYLKKEEYIELSDRRRLQFVKTYFTDCVDIYGSKKGITPTTLSDIMNTARLSTEQ